MKARVTDISHNTIHYRNSSPRTTQVQWTQLDCVGAGARARAMSSSAPKLWYAVMSADGVTRYFVEKATNSTSWTPPDGFYDSPAGDWIQYIDNTTKAPYYVHRKSGETTWGEPDALRDVGAITSMPKSTPQAPQIARPQAARKRRTSSVFGGRAVVSPPPRPPPRPPQQSRQAALASAVRPDFTTVEAELAGLRADLEATKMALKASTRRLALFEQPTGAFSKRARSRRGTAGRSLPLVTPLTAEPRGSTPWISTTVNGMRRSTRTTSALCARCRTTPVLR